MYTFIAEDLLRSCAIDSDYYENLEDWDKLDAIMAVFKYVKNNAENGLVKVPADLLNAAGY